MIYTRRFSFFCRWAGFFIWTLPFSVFSASQDSLTRCQESYGKDLAAQTVETCRLELMSPVSTQKKIAILETLGRAYLTQNESAMAISTWNEASQHASLQHENPNTTEVWARLQVLIGQTHVQANQMEKAEIQFKKTIQTVEQSLGAYSLSAGLVQDAAGTFYALQNKPDQAEAAFKRSRIVYEIYLGKTHARTLETRMNQAIGFLDMNMQKEAKESFNVLAEIVNLTPEYQSDPIRAEILTYLGTLQMRNDQLQEAAQNYQAALEVRQAVFGPDDVRTSQSLNNLGVVLYRAGDFKRAEIALSKAYTIRNDKLGSQDALTLSTQKNLQAVIAAQNASKESSSSPTGFNKTIQ